MPSLASLMNDQDVVASAEELIGSGGTRTLEHGPRWRKTAARSFNRAAWDSSNRFPVRIECRTDATNNLASP